MDFSHINKDQKNVPHRRSARRFLRFSVRSLLVMVTAICVWVGIVTQRAHRLEQAVASLQESGAVIHFDYQLPALEQGLPVPEPPKWLWAWRLVGVDSYDTVDHVALGGDDVTDVDLANIAALPRLRALTIFMPYGQWKCSEKGVRKLAELKDLQGLKIFIEDFDGKRLNFVKDIPHLDKLDLEGSGITDDGLEHLRGATNLKMLNLNGTKVTDAGVARFRAVRPECDVRLDW